MSGTNLGRMPILIVSLVIGIVMATTAIVPLVSDYAEAKTFTNEGYYRMSQYTTTDEFNATWDYEKPYQITINDVVQSLPTTIDVAGVSIIAGDNYYLRYVPASQYISLYYDGVGLLTASVESTTGMTVTVGESSITYALTGSSTTSREVTTMTDFYAVDSEGDYIMKYANKTAYINADSLIYGCGRTSLTNNILGTLVTGNIEDGVTVDIWRGEESTTSSNIKINSVESSDYVDLYEFTSVTFDVAYTYDNVDYTDSLTYSYVIVPYEVAADPDNPAAYKALVKVVPVMAFVALIAAAAYMIYSKRD